MANPRLGSSEPKGGEKRNGSPDGVGIESVIGLNVVLPSYDIAVTSSGEARKFMV